MCGGVDKGPRNAKGRVEQAVDVALLARQRAARRIDELKHKADKSHQVVCGLVALIACNAAVLVKGGECRRREMTGKKRILIHFEDGIDGAVGDGAHNVDLVAIAYDVAEAPCTLVELCRQTKVAVIGDARADELVVLVGLDKISDACCRGRVCRVLAKENLDAQRRMAHALGILKRVPASQLLKAAHIVQQAAKPCQVNVLR